jgi:hypothetical protein
MRGERIDELLGRRIGDFRRRRIEHGDDVMLREHLPERRSTLGPRQVGRDEVVDVGMDREMAGGIEPRAGGEHQRKQDRQPRPPDGKVDDPSNAPGQHILIRRPRRQTIGRHPRSGSQSIRAARSNGDQISCRDRPSH